MLSTEIDSYDKEARHFSPRMTAPDQLDPQSLIPEMRSQVAGCKDNFGRVITLRNLAKPRGVWWDKEDGPYQMEGWGPLFKDALSKMDPAIPGAEDLNRVIDTAIANVIAALTLRSSEGIEKVEASAGWERFLKDTQRWAARWTPEADKREYVLGSRANGIVGGYVELAPRDGFEHISRLALGEMDLDSSGEFKLTAGAMIDVRNQAPRAYKGSFVLNGEERNWEGRYTVSKS